MKLKTPTFPRKPHHDGPEAYASTPSTPAAPVRAKNHDQSPASALRKAAGGLATPARQRNAAAMIAGLAFIIIAGALGASVANSFDDSIQALVAAQDIDEGEPVTENHFREVKIAAAAGDVEVLAPDSLEELTGRVAAGPIGKGSLVHPDQFINDADEERILIGAALRANHYPAGGLKAGDRVRLISLAAATFGDAEDSFVPGQEIAEGEIEEVVPLSGDQVHFAIRVPESSANIVVQLVSDDRISLGLFDESIAVEDVQPLEPEEGFEPPTIDEDADQ